MRRLKLLIAYGIVYGLSAVACIYIVFMLRSLFYLDRTAFYIIALPIPTAAIFTWGLTTIDDRNRQ